MTGTPFENDDLDKTAKWSTRRRTILKVSTCAFPAMVAVTATPAAASSQSEPALGRLNPRTLTMTAPVRAFDPVSDEYDYSKMAEWSDTEINSSIILTVTQEDPPLANARVQLRTPLIAGQFVRFRTGPSNHFETFTDDHGVATTLGREFQFATGVLTADQPRTPVPVQAWIPTQSTFLEQMTIEYIRPWAPQPPHSFPWRRSSVAATLSTRLPSSR